LPHVLINTKLHAIRWGGVIAARLTTLPIHVGKGRLLTGPRDPVELVRIGGAIRREWALLTSDGIGLPALLGVMPIDMVHDGRVLIGGVDGGERAAELSTGCCGVAPRHWFGFNSVATVVVVNVLKAGGTLACMTQDDCEG